MARAKTILQSEFPYNISSRCINREWFSLPMPIVWEIFCEELNKTIKDYNLIVHCFILMSNHYHMLASTPDANISECMQYFNYSSSRKLTREGNRINQTFGGRYFKCIIQEEYYFRCAYKYNYRNPVTASICNKVEDYPYSTLPGLLGLKEPKIIVVDPIAKNNLIGTLNWLNVPPEKEKLEAIQFGLKRQYFKSKKYPTTKKLILNIDDAF